MAEYRVYRTGEDEPVRIVGAPRGSAPRARPLADGRRRGSRRHAGRASSRRLWLLSAVLLTVVAALCAMGWFFGRDMLGNSAAAVDLAKLSGRVPEWTFYGIPVLGLLIIALVAVYLAFGRHLAVKLIGLAVVVTALAAPGLALGWANGTVGTVGSRTVEVEHAVESAQKELRPALPGKPVNILLIGRDEAVPGDPGRSDTQILVRLDPDTKSISMLSLPRDLRVNIPGVGMEKMNAAYFHGGPALVVETFSSLTGLPINHFVEVDFGGFWHAVNILGGVYVPVDRRYYNPESSSYKSIDIKPGYQRLDGHDALDFVRFRRDETGDFGRMQRQQLFLKEAQRQSGRWSGDWTKVPKLIKAIANETTSDINSLRRLKPLVELVFQVDTSNVYTAHLEGSTPTIAGVSYVVSTQEQIDEAVREFINPAATSTSGDGVKITKKMYAITVRNGSGIPGHADAAKEQLASLGYRVADAPDSPDYPGTVNTVYAPATLAAQAHELAAMMQPSTVEVVERTPGSAGGITVFVTSSFDGTLDTPEDADAAQPQQTLLPDQDVDKSSWQALDAKSPLRLEMPSSWVAGSVYDEYRAYALKDTKDRQSAAAAVVVRMPSGGYWSIQAMRWLSPPAIENPSGRETINGTEYLLFHQGKHIRMVAWKRNNTLYWVLNTLRNELSNDTMMGLAQSFKPVQ